MIDSSTPHPVPAIPDLGPHDGPAGGTRGSSGVRPELSFAAMAASYCLGAFNDNFYKQSCMLVAVGLGFTSLQGYIAIAFILPYLLVSAPAGWLADRYSKRTIVILTKGLEVVAMIFGAAGIFWLSWPLVLAMCFTMGIQACVFGPALNGSVPELFPAERVTPANSILKAAMIGAVLLGIALSGVVLERGGILLAPALGLPPEHAGRAGVAMAVIGIALAGLLSSLGTPWRAPAAPTAPFPRSGPLDTLRELRLLAQDPLLWIAALLGTFVWTIGSLEAMLVNPLGKLELGFGALATSGLLAAEMIGVGIGGGVAGIWVKGESWRRLLVPSLLGMSGFLGAMATLPLLGDSLRYPMALGLLTACGVLGGLVLVPCEAYVQVRPPPDRRGVVLGVSGFMFGVGVVVSGLFANLLNALLQPSQGFAVTALLTLALAAYVARLLKEKQS